MLRSVIATALLIVLCASPVYAGGNTENVIGSESPSFHALATNTAKRGLYFFAGLFVVIAVLKRWKGTAQPLTGESISLLSRKMIGGRSALLIIEAEGQKFLISQSGDDIRLLSELHRTDSGESFPAIMEETLANSRYGS